MLLTCLFIIFLQLELPNHINSYQLQRVSKLSFDLQKILFFFDDIVDGLSKFRNVTSIGRS